MRRVAEIVTAGHGHRIEYRNVSAYFVWPKGPIVAPEITGMDSLALVLHEDGHGVAGVCPQREPHRRDLSVRDWWHCIACETAAWRAALDAVPFTLPMFRRLQSSLRSYRAVTPASSAALAELDRLISFTATFAVPRQRKVEAQQRRELVRMWEQELDRQPNSLANCRKLLAESLKVNPRRTA